MTQNDFTRSQFLTHRHAHVISSLWFPLPLSFSYSLNSSFHDLILTNSIIGDLVRFWRSECRRSNSSAFQSHLGRNEGGHSIDSTTNYLKGWVSRQHVKGSPELWIEIFHIVRTADTLIRVFLCCSLGCWVLMPAPSPTGTHTGKKLRHTDLDQRTQIHFLDMLT